MARKIPHMLHILLTVLLILAIPNAHAWLSGWNYRAPVTVDNTGGSSALTDYQVRVTVDTATLIAAGKMNSDCSDVRFTDTADTLLSFYLESGCNTASTVFWVKVPSIPAGGTATIYMYYGNASATSASDPSTTFDFWDDFDSLTNWSVSGATVSGGYLYVDTGDTAVTNSTFPAPMVVDARVTATTQDDRIYYAIQESQTFSSATTISDAIWEEVGRTYEGYHVWNTKSGTTWGTLESSGIAYTVNQYDIVSHYSDGSNVWVCINYDQYCYTARALAAPTGGWYIYFQRQNLTTTTTGGQAVVDWVRVRQFANPEPTTTVGTEEVFSNVMSKNWLVQENPSAGDDFAYGVCADETTGMIYVVGTYDITTDSQSLLKIYDTSGTLQNTYISNYLGGTHEYLVDCVVVESGGTKYLVAAGYYGSPAEDYYVVYTLSADGTTSTAQTAYTSIASTIGQVTTITTDGAYVYVAGYGPGLAKLSFPTISLVSEVSLTWLPYECIYDSTNAKLICGGLKNNTDYDFAVGVYDPSTLSGTIATYDSGAGNDQIYGVATDGTYIYGFGSSDDATYTNVRVVVKFDYTPAYVSHVTVSDTAQAYYRGGVAVSDKYAVSVYQRSNGTYFVTYLTLVDLSTLSEVETITLNGGTYDSYTNVHPTAYMSADRNVYVAGYDLSAGDRGIWLASVNLRLTGVSVTSLTHSPTDQPSLALDPENNVNSVSVEYNAVLDLRDVNLTYYRWYDGDTNTTLEENTSPQPDQNVILYTRTYTAVGDYNTCVYVKAEDASNNVYTDEACDLIHIDQYPQNLSFSWDIAIPFPSETITFTGSATDNGTLSYSWDFGDTNTGSGNPVTHAYSSAGTYTVTMTVTDDVGLSKTISDDVNVYEKPLLTITRTNLAFEGNIVPDSRLQVTNPKWVILDTNYYGNPISIQLSSRYPTGTLSYTLTDGTNDRNISRNLPELNVDYNTPIGFSTTADATASYTTNNFTGTPTCTMTLNGNTTLTLADGSNELKVNCTTAEENYTAVDTFTRNVKHLIFVDEDSGNTVDLNTLTELNTFDMNGSKYDLKGNNATDIYHISTTNVKITVEFVYSADTSATTIARFFDTDLMPTTTEVCIPQFEPFYEILLYSSSKIPVWMQNTASGCYVTASYTDQLYQDAYSTSVYVVPKLYTIHVRNDNGEKVVLGSIYGSKAQTVNLDLLTYKLRQYEVSILTTTYAIERENENEVRIYVYNPNYDNTATQVTIKDENGNILFQHYETDLPNDFQIIFNHATLNITENDLLTLEIVEWKQDGTTTTRTWFFKITGEVGILHPAVGMAISILIAVIAITSVAAELTFGFVGIVGLLFALAVSAFTVSTPEVTLVQTALAIALIYVFLIYRSENKGVV